MVMIPPISGPNVQSSASRDSQGQDARVVVKQSLATTMPSDRQTSLGIMNVEANKASTGDYDQWKRSLFFLALSVSISRVYVGVHYPGDVLFGGLYGYGIAWLFITIWVLIKMREIKRGRTWIQYE